MQLIWTSTSGSHSLRVGSGCGSLLSEFRQNVMPNLLHVNFSLHPWMSSDLLDSGSVLAVVTEESQDEVLEWLRQALSAGLFPVCGVVTLEQQIVEVLVLFGLLEWADSLHDNEKNDTSREDVDLPTIVLLAFFDFGSHVGHGAAVGLQLVDLFVGGEAEVCHLQIDLVIYEDVFKFEVSVDHILALHITKYIQHLGEEIPSGIFAHTTAGLAKIEKETSWDVLEENIYKILDLSS